MSASLDVTFIIQLQLCSSFGDRDDLVSFRTLVLIENISWIVYTFSGFVPLNLFVLN